MSDRCSECGGPWPCNSHTLIGPGEQRYGPLKEESPRRDNPKVGGTVEELDLEIEEE